MLVDKIKKFVGTLAGSFIVLAPLLSHSVYAASATMYLSPGSGSVAQGSTLTVGIRENSGSEPVNAASVVLSYPADKLDFLSISSSSAFGIVAANSGGGGSVHVDRGALPAVAGNQLIANVSFRAKVNSGTATINIAGGSTVVSANSNANILAGASGGSYSLKAPTPAAPAAPKDTIPPTITGIKSSDISVNSATISWTTSEPANSAVDYGLNNGYGLAASDGALVTAHKLVLSSAILTPGTTYHFMVKSADAAGNAVSSADQTFKTTGISLAITVVDQKNKPVSGAKVALGDQSGKTDKNGKVTLNGFAFGKLAGVVTYKNHPTTVTTEIKSLPTKGQAQLPVTFKINVSNNVWIIILPALLVLALLAFGFKKFVGFSRLKQVFGGGPKPPNATPQIQNDSKTTDGPSVISPTTPSAS